MPDEIDQLFREGIRTVREWSPELVGFEPTTNPFDPENPDDARGFLAALEDARRVGGELHIVQDDRGQVSIWTRRSEFFIPEDDPALPGPPA